MIFDRIALGLSIVALVVSLVTFCINFGYYLALSQSISGIQ